MPTVSDQIIKIIELESRNKGLDGQIARQDNDILRGKVSIEAKERAKESEVEVRDGALARLKETEGNINQAKLSIIQAKRYLEDCQKQATSIQGELADLTDDYLATFDANIASMNEGQAKMQKLRESLLGEQADNRVAILEIQTLLKEKGYDFSVGEPTKSKTTYL